MTLNALGVTTVAEPETWTVALIGNPNTGKSTLFGALSGIRQRVGNYPGVTVEKKLGGMTLGSSRWTLVDLPGTYSLAPRSPDEQVAVDVLLGRQSDVPAPDVIVCVVDASNLERNLYLLSQVLELNRPTVVALTMVDVAEGRGMTVDARRLSANLGVPVVPVRADQRVGLDALKEAMATEVGRPLERRERVSPFPEAFQAEVTGLAEVLAASSAGGEDLSKFPRYLVERLLLDTGGYFEGHVLSEARPELREALLASRARLAEGGHPVPAVEAMARYGWVAEVVAGVVARPEESVVTRGDRIDAVLTHRVWGTLILAVAMLLTFNAVFSWATLPMDAIDAGVGALAGLVESSLPEGALRSLLAEGVVG
ncbi:MAG: FeoB small GTPase domain-containing protein, partial [Isosphaeraceae bacterium]